MVSFNGGGRENGNADRVEIEKVSGKDERDERGDFTVVEKFRALLGVKRFITKRPPFGLSEYFSPSPSPSPSLSPSSSPSEAQAPSPAPAVHPCFGCCSVPTGVVVLGCVLGLVCFFGKSKKHNRSKSVKNFLSCGKKGRGNRGRSKNESTRNLASKVSVNPGLDLFYLESLGVDLEQQSLKRSSESVTSSSLHSTNQARLETEALKQEPVKSESDNTLVVLPLGKLSRFTTMQSRNIGSFISKLIWGITPFLADSVDASNAHGPGNYTKQNNDTDTGLVECQMIPIAQGLPSPPPPPPTPPPPPPPPAALLSVSPLHFSSPSSSTRTAHKSPSFSTQKDLSPSRNSDSCSGSDLTPKSDSAQLPTMNPVPAQCPPGIPPPPCPPPLPKGNTSFVKGPPPPPSQFPQFMPTTGKDGAPLPKLKPLHWDKVRATPDRSMVWDKMRSSSFELDEEMIESLFGYNLQNQLNNDEMRSRTPSPSKHLLEPKRLQNITILSKALNASPEQVCDSLIRGSSLSLQQLEALVRMVPTKEEEAKLNGYKGDIDELGSAEKFIKSLLSIPFAFQRVEAMLYKETFDDEIAHLKNSFLVLEEACKELRSSRLFLKLLEAVLKTGNRMNVGTIRGGAKAFKLDALLKLADVKGTDGKTTLLHFVVQEMVRSEGIRVSDSIMGKIDQQNKNRTAEEKEEDYRRMGLDLVAGLSTELYNAKRTATIDLDVLVTSLSNLSDGLAKLKRLVSNDLGTDEKGEKFIHSMRLFISYSEKSMKELKEDEDRVLLHVREITEYFHGDVSKEEANPLRIFVIVRDFLGMLDHVCKELRCFKVPNSSSPLSPFR
ncbi:formin-like protein 11 [Eucalyptus grandis]|uniref:formin-like protein 11 n=1 Tax=Eucalyptus grandis TaxID=71139 RepID=UPI00192EEF8F|nr:formin-like protein 11 [Eucalyptus grandis]